MHRQQGPDLLRPEDPGLEYLLAGLPLLVLLLLLLRPGDGRAWWLKGLRTRAAALLAAEQLP